MNQTLQAGGQQQVSFLPAHDCQLPAPGWGCEQQGRPLPESAAERGGFGTAEDRELLVLGPSACVIGLLYTCTLRCAIK